MDITDTQEGQLRTLVDWLRSTANQETPAPVIWAQLQKGFRERATFLETFVIPNLGPQETGYQRVVPIFPERPKITLEPGPTEEAAIEITARQE